MELTSKGYWSVRSETDSRWNRSGMTRWCVTAGYCPEAKEWLKVAEELYGDYPKDLYYSFHKD